MSIESSEKIESHIDTEKSTVSVTIPDVPKSAHRRVKKWALKLSADRGRSFSVMAAYREFIIEKSKEISNGDR